MTPIHHPRMFIFFRRRGTPCGPKGGGVVPVCNMHQGEGEPRGGGTVMSHPFQEGMGGGGVMSHPKRGGGTVMSHLKKEWGGGASDWNRFRLQIDTIQNCGTFLWTVISKTCLRKYVFLESVKLQLRGLMLSSFSTQPIKIMDFSNIGRFQHSIPSFVTTKLQRIKTMIIMYHGQPTTTSSLILVRPDHAYVRL